MMLKTKKKAGQYDHSAQSFWGKEKKAEAGLVEVSETEKEKLDARVSFLAKYRGCEKGEQKLKMLEAFENDKTCKTWQASFTREVIHTQSDKEEVKTGYKTRPLPENYLKRFMVSLTS